MNWAQVASGHRRDLLGGQNGPNSISSKKKRYLPKRKMNICYELGIVDLNAITIITIINH